MVLEERGRHSRRNSKKEAGAMEQSNCSLDPQTLFDVSGRTALITGCSSGLGEAFAIFLAKCGANVVVAGKLE